MRHVDLRLTSQAHQVIPTQPGPGRRPSVNVHPAVAQLTEGVKLLKQIAADRPALVAAALLGGATVGQIMAVLGWSLADLRMAVGRWAPELRKAGQLTEDQCAALLAIVYEPTSQ